MARASYVFYDTETTGLAALSDEIVEICLIATDENFVPVSKPLHIYAFATQPVSAEVAAINGYDHTLWTERGAITQEEMVKLIIRWGKQLRLWRATHAGHNIAFDEDFLSALFHRHGFDRVYNDMFGYHKVCTVGLSILVDQVLFGTAPRAGRKLEVLTERYGITHDAAHTAVSDILATKDLLVAMMKALRPSSHAAEIPAPSMLSIAEGGAKFLYGKHAGKTVTTVAQTSPGYLQWALDKCNDLPPSHRTIIKTALDLRGKRT